MKVIAAISPQERKAKDETAKLATDYFRERLPRRLPGLDTRSCNVTHSWAKDLGRQFADPRSAFTLLVPSNAKDIPLTSFLVVRKYVSLLDKECRPLTVHHSTHGIFMSIGFFAALHRMEQLMDFEQ